MDSLREFFFGLTMPFVERSGFCVRDMILTLQGVDVIVYCLYLRGPAIRRAAVGISPGRKCLPGGGEFESGGNLPCRVDKQVTLKVSNSSVTSPQAECHIKPGPNLRASSWRAQFWG